MKSSLLRDFISFIKSLFGKPVSEVEPLLSDEHCDQIIKGKEENLKLFNDIIGHNPLEQIDWIVANGFKEFNSLYRSCEDGSLLEREREKKRLTEDKNRIKRVQRATRLEKQNLFTHDRNNFFISIDDARCFHQIESLKELDNHNYHINKALTYESLENIIEYETIELRGGYGNNVIKTFEI